MSETDNPFGARLALGQAERDVLLAVLDPRHTLADCDPTAVDWRAVTHAARAANLLPALADRVLAQTPWRIDPSIRDTLRTALEDTAVHNTRLLAELAHAVSTLRAAGIEHVVLKGAVLLAECYPRIAMRHTVDLDLLIDPQRFDAGIAALRAVGYVDHPHYTTTLVGDGSSLAEAWPAHAHACPPLQAPSGVNVDLHHTLPISDFERSGGFRGWHARSHACVVHGASVQMCDSMDLAAHLCEHFALQHHADPVDAPRLLGDLRALFPEGPPWVSLQTGSRSRRISVALARALYEVAFTQGNERNPMSRFLRSMAIADPSVSPWLSELSHLRGHASRFSYNLRHRPRYALRTLFPTRAYMAQHHATDAASGAVYPLYARRLLTTLFRRRKAP